MDNIFPLPELQDALEEVTGLRVFDCMAEQMDVGRHINAAYLPVRYIIRSGMTIIPTPLSGLRRSV
jgi:hypothetical protein